MEFSLAHLSRCLFAMLAHMKNRHLQDHYISIFNTRKPKQSELSLIKKGFV